MIGARGFEPRTPAVSGRCSPTELRACRTLSLSKQAWGVNETVSHFVGDLPRLR